MKRGIIPLFNVSIDGVKNRNDYDELIRMFSPAADDSSDDDVAVNITVPKELIVPIEKKDEIKKFLYTELQSITGTTLKWGTLTGVKPLKLYEKLLEQTDNKNSKDVVRSLLTQNYLVDETKIDLLERIHDNQKEVLIEPDKREVSVYIGIPFCPTRCTYCSFTSNQSDYDEIGRYMDALYKELDYVGSQMDEHGLKAETIYIGGGTPTTLRTEDLKELIERVNKKIPTIQDFEFTVEAGRPDTIHREKLLMLYDKGVNRISINPQTMKNKSLDIIGRDHTSEDIYKAFDAAKGIGFKAVNADLIAGLPDESVSDFKDTLKKIEKLNPENITVHTLALKKSSKLMEAFTSSNKVPSAEKDMAAENMVGYAEDFLQNHDYVPYYIYRQKYMADNLENVGYAKKGTECVYNIRIMEEKQTVIALGAGGSTKVFFPEENRIERIFNVSNYEIYIERIEEMIDRKRKNLFIDKLT